MNDGVYIGAEYTFRQILARLAENWSLKLVQRGTIRQSRDGKSASAPRFSKICTW